MRWCGPSDGAGRPGKGISVSTFLAVNDRELVNRVGSATRRIVYVAPGVSKAVADAIGGRLSETDSLDVIVVLDTDEDVCRIGYGDVKGLATLHELAVQQHVALRKQAGLRVGVLIVDDDLVIWSPTPQSIEEARIDASKPNGLALGSTPVETLIAAIAPEGSDTTTADAEVGIQAVTPEDVQTTVEAVKKNPVIPVELTQVTRVFSTALQFVELKVTHAQVSKMTVTIANDLLNADAREALRDLLESKIQAFGEVRDIVIPVPMFTPDGEPVFDKAGKRLQEQVSEADLSRRRVEIERRFLFRVGKYGTLVEKSRRLQFEAAAEALKTQLIEHHAGVMANLDEIVQTVKTEAIELVETRLNQRNQTLNEFSRAEIEERLTEQFKRRQGAKPDVSYIYKAVTYEHTQSGEFRKLVQEALPTPVRKQLGSWFEQFRAAREAEPE